MPNQQKVLACPECKSTNLIKNGKRHINRQEVQQYMCKDCWRVTIHPIEVVPRDNKRRFAKKEKG